MNRLWIILGLVTATCCFAAGYWLADRKAPLEHTVFKDRVVVQHSEKHDDIVTVTERRVTKPSGIVTETKTTQIDKSVSIVTRSEHVKETIVSKPQNAPQYALGLTYRPEDKAVGVTLGRRLLGPVWGELQVNQRREWQLGIRVEF